LSFFSNLHQKPILKILSLNSIHIFLKLVFGFITSNAIASYAGPVGMGLIGSFRSFLSLLEHIALLGFQNGIVTYLAPHPLGSAAYRKTVFTAGLVLFLSSLFVSFFCIMGVDYLTHTVLHDQIFYRDIFYLLAILFPLYTGSSFLLALVNGLHYYKKVIQIQLLASCISLVLSLWLIVSFTTLGALVSLILVPVVLLFVLLLYCYRITLFNQVFSFQNFDFTLLKHFTSFALMALVSGVLGSYVLLQIRNEMIDVEGLFKSGIYEGLQRISSYYLIFISSILSLYFLPKLAQHVSKEKQQALVLDYIKHIIPLFGLGLVVLFFLRKEIIALVFSPDFHSMESLFFWQLLGDFLKAISLLFGYILIARKATQMFLVTELFSLFILYVLTHFLLLEEGLLGVVKAHAITYFIYLLVMLLVYKKGTK